MLTRIRCVLRLHRWLPWDSDDGGRFRRCGDCSRSKRDKSSSMYTVQDTKDRMSSGPSGYTAD